MSERLELRIPLDKLVERIAEMAGIEPEVLCQRRRGVMMSEAKSVMCYLATRRIGYSGETVAKILVVRFINSITYQVSSRSNFFQRNGTGASLISAIPLSIRSFNSSLEVTRM